MNYGGIKSTMTISLELPDEITYDRVESLQYNVSTRKNLLQRSIETFEARYKCSLTELERKLENLEIDEHPTWEDSIEWRNAVEQLDYIELSESILAWLQNLLMRSTAS